MNKKKVIALALVTMLSLGGLTGCNKKDDTTKTDNKETTTETENKDETSSTEESKDNEETTDNDDKKTDSTDKKNESTDSKKNNNSSSSNSSTTNTSSSNKSNNNSSSSNTSSSNKPSSGSNSSAPSKSEETKPSHTHTWVDHTATKQVPRTVHHDAEYETVTIPAVTKWQTRCLGCMQWFDSLDEVTYHAFTSPVNDRCGAYAPDEVREVVITPARTEKKLVKKAYDETVYDTKSYTDYQYCSVCGQKK